MAEQEIREKASSQIDEIICEFDFLYMTVTEAREKILAIKELAIVDRTMTFQVGDKRPLKEWVKEVPKDE